MQAKLTTVETILTGTHIGMTLADRDPPEIRRQWIAFHVDIEVDAGWSVATAQAKALRLVRDAIDEEINRLSNPQVPTA